MSTISQARLCGVASQINQRTPFCNIIPMCPTGANVNNRELYSDCTSNLPQFAIQRPTENCLLRFEGETEGSSESTVSGPVCCNCGDKLEFVGIPPVQVRLVNGAIEISRTI